MPIVSVKTVENLLSPQKKKKLHQKLTELMVEIEGNGDPDFARYVVVHISEEPADHFSGGSHPLSPELFKD